MASPAAAVVPLTRQHVCDAVDAYGVAWTTQDPERIAQLFSEDAVSCPIPKRAREVSGQLLTARPADIRRALLRPQWNFSGTPGGRASGQETGS